MKLIFKRRYLVSALGLAMMGSASASSLQIEVTSSQPEFGDGNGCTLTGAIEVARTKNIAPHQAHGCDKTLTILPGNDPSLIWADRSKVSIHFLEKTQVIDFPLTIHLSAQLNGNGNVVNDFPALSFLLPSVVVNRGNRHFEVIHTSDVKVKGMNLYGAEYSLKKTYPIHPTNHKSSPADMELYFRTASGGGSVLVYSAKNISFDHVRLARNSVDNALICFVNNITGQSPVFLANSPGTAMSILSSSQVVLANVDFEDNLTRITNDLPQGCPYTVMPQLDGNFTGTLFVASSDTTILQTRFLNNQADAGSAIYADTWFTTMDTTLKLENVEMSGNYSTLALGFSNNANTFPTVFEVAGSSKTSADLNAVNISKNYAAGIHNKLGTVNMRKSAIVGNALHAIANRDGIMYVENSLIAGNLMRFFPFNEKDKTGAYVIGGSQPESAIFNVRSPSYVYPIGGELSLNHVTVANNGGDYAIFTSVRYIDLNASILSHTASATTCGGNTTWKLILSLGANIDNNDNTCGLDVAKNDAFGPSANANLLGISYVQNVGPTGFLTMPIMRPAANSPALHREAICSVKEDQIGNPRPTETPCDSGAIEMP